MKGRNAVTSRPGLLHCDPLQIRPAYEGGENLWKYLSTLETDTVLEEITVAICAGCNGSHDPQGSGWGVNHSVTSRKNFLRSLDAKKERPKFRSF